MISLIANIDLPASKSISNRVLMIQALSEVPFEIENLSAANDTILFKNILNSIKEIDEIQIIDVEDAGTPFRFLTAYLSTLEGKSFLLTGTERMNERPISSLVNALKTVGANISYQNKEGFPPLLIHGQKLQGNEIHIDSAVSSQFVSAVCLIAPTFENGLTINLSREIVSSSYIEMTLKIMQDFGIEHKKEKLTIFIPAQKYQPRNYSIESDWSSACFFYATAMIAENATIVMNGLHELSSQGDSHFIELAKQFGIHSTFNNKQLLIKKTQPTNNNSQPTTYNLKNHPDLAIPFIVACAIKFPSTKITGIHHLVFKESNRIEALQTELQKVNIFLHYENDILSFENKIVSCLCKEISFKSYKDHRIVMALNMFSFIGFDVNFDDKECVKKSFPSYWNEFNKLMK